MTVSTCSIETPLGVMTAAAQGGVLTGLWFVGQKYYPRPTADWLHQPDLPVFARLRRYLAGYFSGGAGTPDVPLAPAGTLFQHAVWEILLLLPRGRVTTYGRIAQQIVRTRNLAPVSARSVGGAVGHNPISILIPCHRVIGAGGSLTGYAGGIDRKRALLRVERAAMEPIDIGGHSCTTPTLEGQAKRSVERGGSTGFAGGGGAEPQ